MAERICPRCGALVPKVVVIKGKKHNCQRRKYCLTCSPFGKHNTRQIEFDEQHERQNGRRVKQCFECGDKHNQKGKRCTRCVFYKRKTEVSEKVRKIVGSACWICGYDKTKRNLCFHHVDESTKLFCLTIRELMLKWDRVLAEMKKCIFVCANCHGEIHERLISLQKVKRIWSKRWT